MRSGLNPEGYFSDKEMTNYDAGFGECRPATNPTPAYGDGVVTPHAAFLAMMYRPARAYHNLSRIQRRLDAYGPGGFYDAVAVRSGTVAERYLSLDQAMIMGALGNVLGRDVLQRAFSTRRVEAALRPDHRDGEVRFWQGAVTSEPRRRGHRCKRTVAVRGRHRKADRCRRPRQGPPSPVSCGRTPGRAT
jgi:hypothetical protein